MTRSEAANSPDDLPSGIGAMWRVLRLGFRSEPRLLVASLSMTVLQALPDALVALWLALLTDGALSGNRTTMLIGAGGLAVSATSIWALQVTLQRTVRRLGDRLNIMFQGHVAQLQAKIPTIDHHERPELLDRIAVLRTGVFALDHLFASMFTLVGWTLRLVFVTVLLMAIHPALGLLVLAAGPLLYVASWRPAVEKAVEESVAPHGRLSRHLFLTATSTPPAKELRLSSNRELIAARRLASWERWFTPQRDAQLASGAWLAGAWGVFGLAFVAAVAWLTARGGVTPAEVVLVLTAGGRLSAYVGSAVGELGFLRGIWLDSARRLAWLEDYADAAGAHTDLSAPDSLAEGIRLSGVSFAYPGSNKLVLKDVDLLLPAGAVVAIVGENGAGKSTLVKLLARMYPPTSGTITADGIDLARIDSGQWRERLSGAFQDFARWEFVAGTTVGLGDQPRLEDRGVVADAVARAGADSLVDDLASGLDTQLGPSWDDGVDVSFGQWQKLALARGYMRPAPLLLMLDEPTAALDAETEHALFERYAAGARSSVAAPKTQDPISNGRVTVLVSHRFSTVRMADLIVVLDGNQVAEVGTHEELMRRAGIYAELYSIQASSYS